MQGNTREIAQWWSACMEGGETKLELLQPLQQARHASARFCNPSVPAGKWESGDGRIPRVAGWSAQKKQQRDLVSKTRWTLGPDTWACPPTATHTVAHACLHSRPQSACICTCPHIHIVYKHTYHTQREVKTKCFWAERVGPNAPVRETLAWRAVDVTGCLVWGEEWRWLGQTAGGLPNLLCSSKLICS